MSDPLLGSHFGPYKIVALLGEGGMGSVYMAVRDDAQFHKRVAIKVLKGGADSPDAMRRFQLERQMLAALDHPSIVRLLDAGVTPSGIPWVVMDHVEGVPIDKYCVARDLSLRARLRLFLGVCTAVQYAHQQLVVHCDIKPANILVTVDGTPKLLDFGIGKLLARSSETAAGDMATGGFRPVTPDHASPEQLLGQPITTATDIYALGLTLYEILTGRPAYSATTELEVAYKITSTEPEPPSKAAADARMRGDIDAIVLKAMARDPAARYASAAEMADDINRHLSMLPVSVLSGSPRYRIYKFIERNRFPVMAGSLAAVLLVAAVCTTAWEGIVAQQERARAERRFNDVRKLVNVLLFDFYDSAGKVPGATQLQEHMVTRSVEYLDSLAKDATDDIPLAADAVDGYVKFGDIQGNPYRTNLGDTAGAVASYQKALDVSGKLLKSHPGDARLERGAARAHQGLGDVWLMVGKPAEGLAHTRSALAIFERLAKANPKDPQARMDLASCLEGLGDQLGHPGLLAANDKKGAIESYGRSLENWRAASKLVPDNERAKLAPAILQMKIGDMQADAGNSTEALNSYRTGLAVTAGLTPDLQTRRAAASLHRKLGALLAENGDAHGAEQNLRASLAEFEALSASDPVNVGARLDVVNTWNSLGDYYAAGGNSGQAVESYAKAAGMLETLAAADPSNLRYSAQLAEVLIQSGAQLAKSRQQPEALRQTRRGLDLIRRLADNPESPAGQLDRAAYNFLNCVPEQLRDPHQAMLYAKRAVELTNSSDAGYLNTLSDAELASGGDRVAALQTVQKALSLNPPPSLKKALQNKMAGL